MVYLIGKLRDQEGVRSGGVDHADSHPVCIIATDAALDIIKRLKQRVRYCVENVRTPDIGPHAEEKEVTYQIEIPLQEAYFTLYHLSEDSLTGSNFWAAIGEDEVLAVANPEVLHEHIKSTGIKPLPFYGKLCVGEGTYDTTLIGEFSINGLADVPIEFSMWDEIDSGTHVEVYLDEYGDVQVKPGHKNNKKSTGGAC